MSFDLFILLPKLEPSVAQAFNDRAAEKGVTCRFRVSQCTSGAEIWELFEGDESVAELYPAPLRERDEIDRVDRLRALQWELHFPSHGEGPVFLIAGLLAEVGSGFVSDPQQCADEFEIEDTD
jgi:hypothetical protein